MKIVHGSIKEIAQNISSFAKIGEIYILEIDLATEVFKILSKHKRKKFKMSIFEVMANIWRSK